MCDCKYTFLFIQVNQFTKKNNISHHHNNFLLDILFCSKSFTSILSSRLKRNIISLKSIYHINIMEDRNYIKAADSNSIMILEISHCQCRQYSHKMCEFSRAESNFLFYLLMCENVCDLYNNNKSRVFFCCHSSPLPLLLSFY